MSRIAAYLESWSGRPWLLVTGLVLLYAGTALVAEWSFLPLADEMIYDGRAFCPVLDDKADEFPSPNRGLIGGPWFNQREKLPIVLSKLMAVVLPEYLAYNLLHLIAWILAGLATFGLGRKLGASNLAAATGGLMLVLSPTFRGILRYQSLDFGMVFWLPLLGLVLLRAAQPGRRRDLVAVALVVMGLCATNYYYLVSGMTLAAALLVTASLKFTPEERAKKIKRILIAVGVGFVLTVPQLALEISDMRFQGGMGYLTDVNLISARMEFNSVFVPWALFVLPLFVASLLLSWKTAASRRTRCALGGLALLWFGLVMLLCFGQALIAEFVDALPLFWRMRRVDRFMVLPLVLVCVLAGLGLSDLAKRLGPRYGSGLIAASLVVTMGLGLWTSRTLAEEARRWPSYDLPEAVVETLRREDPSTMFWFFCTERLDGSGLLRFDLGHKTGLTFLEEHSEPNIPRDLFSGFRLGWERRVGPTPPDELNPLGARERVRGGVRTVRRHLDALCPVVLILDVQIDGLGRSNDLISALLRSQALEQVSEVGKWVIARPSACLTD